MAGAFRSHGAMYYPSCELTLKKRFSPGGDAEGSKHGGADSGHNKSGRFTMLSLKANMELRKEYARGDLYVSLCIHANPLG